MMTPLCKRFLTLTGHPTGSSRREHQCTFSVRLKGFLEESITQNGWSLFHLHHLRSHITEPDGWKFVTFSDRKPCLTKGWIEHRRLFPQSHHSHIWVACPLVQTKAKNKNEDIKISQNVITNPAMGVSSPVHLLPLLVG